MTLTVVVPDDMASADQRWLDERVSAVRHGMEALLDIAANWTEGRCVSRLHPGTSAAEYVVSRIGVQGREVIGPLLLNTDWSNVQIARIAGVADQTVRRARIATSTNVEVDRPARTLGADGKYRPARVVREVVAEVVEGDDDEDIAFARDESGVAEAYVAALRAYIADIVRVQPPTLGDPPALFKRRHKLERNLQAVLTEVMS